MRAVRAAAGAGRNRRVAHPEKWVRVFATLVCLGMGRVAPAMAQGSAASVRQILGIEVPWGAPDTTWHAAFRRAGWTLVDRERDGRPIFVGRFLGRTMRLTAHDDKAYGVEQGSSRRITWLALSLRVDSADAAGAVAAIVDSLTPALGVAAWGYGVVGRARALERGLLNATWSSVAASTDEVMVSHLVDLLLIAIASQEHKQALAASFERLRSREPVTRPVGSTTVEAEAAPEPWRVYEEWEVDTPAALLSCREKAPPVARRGEVEIRFVVDAFGLPMMPSVDPSAGLYLSMTEEDELEEWVRDECRFVAAEKLGRPVQSRFTLTVRYR